MESRTLGIDIGSTSVKVCVRASNGAVDSRVLAHDGDVDRTLLKLLGRGSRTASLTGVRAVVTGNEGRHRLALPEVIAPVAIERALAALAQRPRAIVSMGGEDLVVYALDAEGRIISTFSGNKCASGTGEFFRQQLGRMAIQLEDLDRIASNSGLINLSARCSVFMKSDCTHRLNKGEATPGDVALSMCKLMADKVSDFLVKAHIKEGLVLLTGGVTRNRFIQPFLAETWPDIQFETPDQAVSFEAFGASLLASDIGQPLPAGKALFCSAVQQSYERFEPLAELEHMVTYAPSARGTFDPQCEYILGVDGGSTTTKIALVNAETKKLVAAHYGRTHGDPVRALKECVREVTEQLDGQSPRISLVATTGSSRELLGVFLQTAGVYNEIVAHAVGTAFFEPETDTVFEIGGQDAKYVYLDRGVPVDYAMNEACSAGTGSFLEESARGDLNIEHAEEIGPVALSAKAPLKFGEHCSAFINSDIRKAIQQGATREDITAGVVFSVVANYLNRVVGNRMIGSRVALQGGVAKNPAVPLAFARLTGRNITVPPEPELMGAFGVALLADKKHAENLLQKGSFVLEEILGREMATEGAFRCRACDNSCEIRNLKIASTRYPFGGRCSKFTNARRGRKSGNAEGIDYTQVRSRLLLEDYAPPAEGLAQRTDKVVGVPRAFSFHSLWPLYGWFFHELGVPTMLSDAIDPEGIARVESSYCFPAEVAHGAIENVLKRGADFLFLPHFKDMRTAQAGTPHATVCPLTQGLPFFARQAFRLEPQRILRPLVSFKSDGLDTQESFVALAEQLGFNAAAGARAFERGHERYNAFLAEYHRLGEEVLERIIADPDQMYVTLLGRPYNAFTRDANMGIPRKFTSHGITVVPFDMICNRDDEAFRNMYWYYGQQNMKATRRVTAIENLYLTWISNFSCAPDSFMLHYVRWLMGRKPYLVLEIDSHTADAGIDTRIEAFLDIVASYRRSGLPAAEETSKRRCELVRKKEYLDVVDHKTGERIDLRDPRVTLVWPSMGDLSVEATSAAANKAGINSTFLPVPDGQTTQLARNVASGKECIPALLVLGSILKFLEQHPPNRPDEYFLFFVPSTTGPCRTGQYYVYYERLFQDLGWENAIVLVGEADNSYRELGPTFNRDIWWALVLGDYFTDIRIGIKLMAHDVDAGMEVFERNWKKVVSALTRGTKALEDALAVAGRELSAIPRHRTLGDLRKVLVVGEIYVRRDTFSIREISEYLVSQGIYPKVTDITEWVRYTDFNRKTAMDLERLRAGWMGALTNGVFKEKVIFHVENFYKDMVQHKVARHLLPTGLIASAPHDMQQIMANAEKHFIDRALESEATVSSGVAATAMEDGFSGVAIIAPFACLPGRLIEGVYAPWARERGYPVIALENDGQPYPPSTQARMEIFAHNVLRYQRQTAD